MVADGAGTRSMAREPLDRARVVQGGIEIADAEGVGALSMRHLARHLGYEAMSLYNHVANKDELLALMVDDVAGEIDPIDPDDAPLAAVRALAVSLHEVLVRHPWSADLWQRQFPGSHRVQLMEDLLRLFAESGLSPDLGHHGFHAVTNHVLGYTIQQIGMADALPLDDAETIARDFIATLEPEAFPRMIAHVHEHLAGKTESSFELVLDLILDGLVRLDAER
ncbi:MAG: TetR/AcrR family transcriptional regulator [Actinomycetota bacterium]